MAIWKEYVLFKEFMRRDAGNVQFAIVTLMSWALDLFCIFNFDEYFNNDFEFGALVSLGFTAFILTFFLYADFESFKRKLYWEEFEKMKK